MCTWCTLVFHNLGMAKKTMKIEVSFVMPHFHTSFHRLWCKELGGMGIHRFTQDIIRQLQGKFTVWCEGKSAHTRVYNVINSWRTVVTFSCNNLLFKSVPGYPEWQLLRICTLPFFCTIIFPEFRITCLFSLILFIRWLTCNQQLDMVM